MRKIFIKFIVTYSKILRILAVDINKVIFGSLDD